MINSVQNVFGLEEQCTFSSRLLGVFEFLQLPLA